MKKLMCVLILYASELFSSAVTIVNIHQKQHSLYRFELQAIFSLKAVMWDNGQVIIPIFMEFDSDVHKDFVRHTLRFNQHEFRRDVESNIVNGSVYNVYIAHNQTELLNLLESLPGSIGYLDEYTIMMVNDGQFKTINIID